MNNMMEVHEYTLLHELRGTVEGYPTSKLNYLQRIRELRLAEEERDIIKAKFQAFLEGLEMQHIEKLMSGTVDDLRKVGEVMSARIKERAK